MNKRLLCFIILTLFLPLNFSCKKDPKPPLTRGTYRLCSNLNPYYRYVKGGDTAIFFFPNIFTPNGDGIDDNFSFFHINIDSLDCTVKDGANIIYHRNGIDSTWNGLINNTGAPAAENDYTVVIIGVTHWGVKFTLNGTISLTRWDNTSDVFINCDTCTFSSTLLNNATTSSNQNPLFDEGLPDVPNYHCN